MLFPWMEMISCHGLLVLCVPSLAPTFFDNVNSIATVHINYMYYDPHLALSALPHNILGGRAIMILFST